MKNFAIRLAIFIVLFFLLAQLFLPVLTFDFFGWIALTCFLGGAVFSIGNSESGAITAWLSFGVLFTLASILGIALTWSAFHDDEYQKLLGEPEKTEVNKLFPPTDQSNIAFIDPETAERLIDKVLGESDQIIGSQMQVGHLDLQAIDGRLYYVAPLVHANFFKWASNNKTGTTAFVKISATDENDRELVEHLPNGSPVQLIYQPQAFFGQKLERHVYNNGYASVGLSDAVFEVDDNGYPWYVITTYEHTIGFGGAEPNGILVIHPTTGDIQSFEMDSIPSWIDRAYPLDIINSQVKNWGRYVNGWYNSLFSERDVRKATEGTSLIYGSDGQCYYYTGITSSGTDDATLGFLMIGSNNKRAIYYKGSGATEQAAMKSAEGAYSNFGYRASFPRPYNIDGAWTYVMSMKDGAGLIKGIATVNVEKHEIVGTGENMRATVRSYKEHLFDKGNSYVASVGSYFKTTSGIVQDIKVDMRDGTSYYYIKLQDVDSSYFTGASSVSESIVLTNIGDSVTISHDNIIQPVLGIIRFKNHTVETWTHELQEDQESYFKENETARLQDENVWSTEKNWEDTMNVNQRMEFIEERMGQLEDMKHNQ